MQGRKTYQRPQALLLANNSGTIETVEGSSFYVPVGTEFTDFIILSDDNRGPIDMAPDRIEKRERTINGRMRSYHIADKMKINVSWNMLPSRAFSTLPGFDEETGKTALAKSEQYTTDGGAGGVEILDWYQNNVGSFFVYLAYDKHTNFGDTESSFTNLAKYNQIMEVFFSDFKYTIVKRGGSTYDFWNVSFSLEEV
jgi:hypothetical protein